MDISYAIRQALCANATSSEVEIFPALLIKYSSEDRTLDSAAKQALEYYQINGLAGDLAKFESANDYARSIRSVNSEPPWINSFKIEEVNGDISSEREFELRPLTRYVQDTNDEFLLKTFQNFLLERKARIEASLGFKTDKNDSFWSSNQKMEENEFRSLICLAKALGPEMAYDLEQILLCSFGPDSNGITLGAGAPDLLLWSLDEKNPFWFFSEVKAHGDYLNRNQKNWISNHWNIIQGHFLLTILE